MYTVKKRGKTREKLILFEIFLLEVQPDEAGVSGYSQSE